jgi:hypothetical protein
MPPRASKDDFGEFRTNTSARVQAPKRLDIRDRELGSKQSREQKAIQKHEQSFHTKQPNDLEELASISTDPRVLEFLSKLDNEVSAGLEEKEGSEEEESKMTSNYRVRRSCGRYMHIC